MVVLEASAAGLPFAASAVGGIPDLITHRTTGLLFDPSQRDGVLDAIESMIADKGWAEQLATSARVRAADQFSAESVARQHLTVYNDVVAAHFAEAGEKGTNLQQ
jgi:glycosyltransferase involved in cell wall biosynthesis